MSQDGMDLSRRDVVRTVGAGTAAAGVAGVSSAGSAEVNVGIEPGARGTVSTAKGKADSVRKQLDFGDVRTVVTGTFSTQAIEALQNNPNVAYVERNGQMQKLAQTLPWGIDRVDADNLISGGQTGSGATVAVLDTGIDDDHPDLQANVVGGKAFETQCGAESGGCRYGGEGYNGNSCNFTWSDDDDHGSHVAGTASGVDNTAGVVGVAPGADLLAGKVLTGCGSGSFSAISSGVKWAADQGADVINMSLGASSGSSTLKDACQYAYDNNVVIVASAGNSGPCTDCVGFPAAYSTVVAVSATTPSDSLAGYSSTGTNVELAAPGGASDGSNSTSVLSTIPPESDSDGEGYAYFNGTSMASPHVAGAAAQVVAETSLTDNQKIIDQLKSTAENIGLSSSESGAGLVDPEAAVGGGGGDAAPSVSFGTPSSGSTVSGTVTVQISASDSEDSDSTLDVTYTVGGGSSRTTTFNSTSGFYEDSLDTTQFSDGDTTFAASVTDSAGNTSTTSVTATIDNVNGAPAVDSLSAAEVETSDSDAEFDASWSVSDSDGDLSSVDLTLTQDSDGTTEDTATVSVSGSSASGTARLVATGDEASGNAYTVSATVSDSGSNTASSSTSVSETESTNAAPTPSIDGVSNNSNPAWNRFDVSWSASDGDGNLSSVTVELRDAGGATVDSVTVSASGSSASGNDRVESKNAGSTVAVTATDTDGASNTTTQSV